MWGTVVQQAVRHGCASAPRSLLSPCPLCARDTTEDPWHPLACQSVRRRAITTRHDRGMDLVAKFARSCSVLARFEPKDAGSLVPDGELIFSQDAELVDLSGVHSLAPSHLHNSPQPGLAVEREGRPVSDEAVQRTIEAELGVATSRILERLLVATTFPGHQAMVGSRLPPSQMSNFPPSKPAEL